MNVSKLFENILNALNFAGGLVSANICLVVGDKNLQKWIKNIHMRKKTEYFVM
jgi:hypothetical protein